MTQRLHDRIRLALESNPALTQKDLAKRMGLNPAAINRMLYGRRNIMAEEIPIIEAYLGISLQQMSAVRRAGLSDVPADSFAPAPQTLLPVYRCSEDGLDRSAVADWVPLLPAQAGIRDAFAIYAFSDDMAPRYFRRELVYIHPGRPAEEGGDCLVETAQGAMLRRLVREDADGFVFRQYNPARDERVAAADVRGVYSVIARG
jgi:transcriptional regulator with XRE-family HTH domain